ncbi:MarR family transcriptional regulator [Pacificimonas sp. WHA3]|uniref:MarR family transcriptional regulator n=1 Tax=Pacificimonas pallii TaxID=2827236 RepID=A0ABS6SGF6_9SPHN|nr:MarR family transcriptional regulator [Pacificimonas pallii]MBV7257503.1 MarR family transcriptional regulator [Pacificimonas pallii]
MFFLKDLPTQRMLQRYAAEHPEMDVDKVAAALTMMRRASVLIRALDAYFAAFDLSLLRFLILIVIDREAADARLTIGDIGRRIDVSKPVMTRTLKRLADGGLIDIAPDGADKRSKVVTLTAAGQDRLARTLPGYFKMISGDMATAM